MRTILIKETPWDQKVFGINTFEIIITSEEDLFSRLNQIRNNLKSGHYTIKINPLWNKKTLFDCGFYYCDTLIQPYCSSQTFLDYKHKKISISQNNSHQELIEICHGTFNHGRFHRDFNLDRKQADLRYSSWLSQLFNNEQVWGLMYEKDLAGFWGFSQEKILLHALKPYYRGKGMAKYFWSAACQKMFDLGYSEIISSISASNMPVHNLYISLGFKFKNPQDVYHLLIE